MSLTVVNYHAIGDGELSRTEEKFTDDLEVYKANGDLITIYDYLAGYSGFAITFDDGKESQYNVLELMDAPAMFFIITDFVGKKGYMTWKQLKELHKAGHKIESHTHTHRALTNLNREQTEYELKKSADIIEEKIGVRPRFLSLPGHEDNKYVVDVAKELGYWGIRGGGESNTEPIDFFNINSFQIINDSKVWLRK